MLKNLRNSLKKPLLPFSIFLIMIAIAYLYTYRYPFWTNLQICHASLKSFAEIHPIQAPLLFITVYILYALLSLPGIFVLSLIAGCLFEQPFSTLYPTIAATIGASFLFLVARTAFGHFFYINKEQHVLHKLEHGFRQDAANYLLFLRLIPMFPFFIVNIAAAFFKVPFRVFVWTTCLGMIPSIFVYAQAGKGLTLLLDSPGQLSSTHLLNPHLVVALIGLAFLALLPILFKYLKLRF